VASAGARKQRACRRPDRPLRRNRRGPA
jgi:hypothetical protein